MRIAQLTLGLVVFVLLPGFAVAGRDEVSLGRARAIESCSGCHQVTSTQKPPNPVANPEKLEMVDAPSFAQIATKYERHDAELRAFIRAPRHPMKEQQFLDTDLNAIVTYIHSLHDRKAEW